MIRLGSLAGYPFDGPRLLAGWTPPQAAAVYAVLYKPDPAAKPENYAVIYVGHADDLSNERFPFKHPRAACWIQRAGSKWKVYIASYQVPGGTGAHREQITHELAAVYRPGSTSSSTTTRGRTSGSASTRRRRTPPRSPAAAPTSGRRTRRISP